MMPKAHILTSRPTHAKIIAEVARIESLGFTADTDPRTVGNCYTAADRAVRAEAVLLVDQESRFDERTMHEVNGETVLRKIRSLVKFDQFFKGLQALKVGEEIALPKRPDEVEVARSEPDKLEVETGLRQVDTRSQPLYFN